MYKLIALVLGWREAYDADEGLLVVYHPSQDIHFAGERAWKRAVRYSCRGTYG